MGEQSSATALKAMAEIAADPDFRQPKPLLWMYQFVDKLLHLRREEKHSGWY